MQKTTLLRLQVALLATPVVTPRCNAARGLQQWSFHLPLSPPPTARLGMGKFIEGWFDHVPGGFVLNTGQQYDNNSHMIMFPYKSYPKKTYHRHHISRCIGSSLLNVNLIENWCFYHLPSNESSKVFRHL